MADGNRTAYSTLNVSHQIKHKTGSPPILLHKVVECVCAINTETLWASHLPIPVWSSWRSSRNTVWGGACVGRGSGSASERGRGNSCQWINLSNWHGRGYKYHAPDAQAENVEVGVMCTLRKKNMKGYKCLN